MIKRKDGKKITLGMLKGKPMTTSVPSIAVKFHANAEQLEEVYGSDEDGPSSGNTSSVISEPDNSPLKLFPKLVKRSTSIDVSAASSGLDSSPPSDPWRFFAGFKDKFTKTVEDKLTDFKTRKEEEGSPFKSKPVKDSKESSSLSDSEDLSESSISKTCGIVSTTEGVEMSSEDETPSLDKDRKEGKKNKGSSLRQRFRLLRKSGSKEGSVGINAFSKLYNINTEKVEQALPEDSEEVESAVDALEESIVEDSRSMLSSEEIIRVASSKYLNLDVDEDSVVNVKEVTGRELRNSFFNNDEIVTVFAPTGFVDLRGFCKKPDSAKYKPWMLVSVLLVFFLVLQKYSPFIAGIFLGIIVTLIIVGVYEKFFNSVTASVVSRRSSTVKQILEMPVIKEHQPIVKYEGWINEYPDVYDPMTYHIAKTQSVFLRLQGSLLRMSHSKTKIAKRATWNEQEIKASFTHHRIYNLFGAKIMLLPEGLAKTRLWSKKYPICIQFNKEQMNFDPVILSNIEEEDKEKENEKTTPKEKKSFSFRKKDIPILSQRFSKLTEEEDVLDLDSDSRASSPSFETSENGPDNSVGNENDTLENMEEDEESSTEDWSKISPEGTPSSEIRLYIFGRTDREKEDWFRRLMAASKSTSPSCGKKGEGEGEENESKSLDREYLKYMQMFVKQNKQKSKQDIVKTENEEPSKANSDLVIWFNSLIGRILFDCMHDPNFTVRVRDRIQRKLAAIKLPYFIEEITITELNLGEMPPLINNISKPTLDQRGLWINLDLNYEGLVTLTLQTKLNLMKLKNPQNNEKRSIEVKSAIFHSDVDDSAESSSDDEPTDFNPSSSEASNTSAGGSKKFIKMVDRIAESKFFQAATENRYIKKAMEGVSNTDLSLTVQIKMLEGVLVLNIPPPPSDRVWVGFKPVPELLLSARPIVGERNVNFIYVTNWIENKLIQEFQKVMVIPNMEDFIIPVMNSNLPD